MTREITCTCTKILTWVCCTTMPNIEPCPMDWLYFNNSSPQCCPIISSDNCAMMGQCPFSLAVDDVWILSSSADFPLVLQLDVISILHGGIGLCLLTCRCNVIMNIKWMVENKFIKYFQLYLFHMSVKFYITNYMYIKIAWWQNIAKLNLLHSTYNDFRC